jgi:hypothetical protein
VGCRNPTGDAQRVLRRAGSVGIPGMCGEPPFPTPTSAVSGQWSMRSWPLPARVTSTRLSRCSTRRWCCAPDRAVPAGAPTVVRGARAVAGRALAFTQFAPFARAALVNGTAGFVVAPHGRPFSVIGLTITGGKIVEIDIVADPVRLSQLDLAGLDD